MDKQTSSLISWKIYSVFLGTPPVLMRKVRDQFQRFSPGTFFDLAVLWLAVVARIQQLTAPIWPSLQSVRSTSKTSILYWSVEVSTKHDIAKTCYVNMLYGNYKIKYCKLLQLYIHQHVSTIGKALSWLKSRPTGHREGRHVTLHKLQSWWL